MTVNEKALYQLFVARYKLALVSNRAIPFKAVGFPGGNNPFVGPRLLPGRVDILDTQQPFATVDARLEIAGDSGQ